MPVIIGNREGDYGKLRKGSFSFIGKNLYAIFPILLRLVGKKSAFRSSVGMQVYFPINRLKPQRAHSDRVGSGITERHPQRCRFGQDAFFLSYTLTNLI
jgi:hypothetical protein